MPAARDMVERFWEKVEKTDGCWLWTASVNWRGYGRLLGPGRKVLSAHRISFELNVGPIGDGLYVCHHCDNPKCVRPDHLFLGTSLDNNRDMQAKGRGGSRKGQFKTVCKWGHRFNDANTYFGKNGHRTCRTCHRAKVKRLSAAKRMAA